MIGENNMKLRRISHVLQGSIKKRFTVSLLLIASLTVIPARAQSAAFTAHITQVLNGQGAPISFDFTTDNTPSNCNGYIVYTPVGADEPSKIANFNTVYATALAALLSGHSVAIGVNFPSSGSNFCSLVYFNPTNQ
jgi:hypothetical protein